MRLLMPIYDIPVQALSLKQLLKRNNRTTLRKFLLFLFSCIC